MMLLLTLVLAAIAPDAHVEPSAAELVATIDSSQDVSGPVSFRLDTIRSLRCRAFDEEPTERRCRFRAWAAEGRWIWYSAIVARDRKGWVLLSLD